MSYRKTIPASAITPGAQITDLRSTVPTAPTNVVWASTSYVDFVADAGADPTGVADCGPAFTTAINLLRTIAANPQAAETAVELFIPPGLYNFPNPATINHVFNFAPDLTSSVRIRGSGDASVFMLTFADTAAVFAEFANMNRMEVCDLAFTGQQNGSPDTGGIFIFAPLWDLHVHDISVVGLISDGSFFVAESKCEFDHMQFLDCAQTAAAQGMIGTTGMLGSGASQVRIRDIQIVDVGRLNGVVPPGITSLSKTSIYVQGPCESVLIENVLVDEHCTVNIELDGAGAGNEINYAELRGVIMNLAANAAAVGGLVAKDVHTLIVKGVSSATNNPAVPSVILETVFYAELTEIAPGGTAPAVVVSADAGCVVVKVKNSEVGFPVSALASSAAVTQWGDGTPVVRAATWYVDPANVSGHADDGNAGTVSTAPVLTFNGGILSKWGTTAPVIPQDTLLQWLSSQPAPPAPPDPVILEPIMQGAVLTVQGVLGAAQEISSGTIGAVTPKNRATPQLLDITTSGTIAPVGTLVQRTSGAGAVSYAWVYVSEAGNKAQMTQPMTDSALPLSPVSAFAEDNGWALMDAYVAYAPVSIQLAHIEPRVTVEVSPDFPAPVQVDALTLSADVNLVIGPEVTFSRCLLKAFVNNSASTDALPAYLFNCFVSEGAYSPSGANTLTSFFAGAMLAPGGVLASWQFDYDAILDATADTITIDANSQFSAPAQNFGSVYIAGVVFIEGTSGFIVNGGVNPSGESVLWGPGTLDAIGQSRIYYGPVVVQDAAVTFINTGGLKLNQQANANAFNPASGLWSTPIAITSANLDLAFGAGGFGGLAVNVGGASITSQGTP